MSGYELDTELMSPRRVLSSEPDRDGLGFIVELTCGHTIWSAITPGDRTCCGLCLHRLIEQIRALQARQRVP